MTLSALGFLVLFFGLVGVVLGWCFHTSETDKSKTWHARMSLGLRRQNRNIDKLERVTRLEVIKTVLRGERCRGCSKIVDKDDMDVVGEDARQREIRMCRECRVLMGLDDKEPKVPPG